jgi:hypothetical protein
MPSKQSSIVAVMAMASLLLAILGCHPADPEEPPPENNPYASADLAVEIIPAPNDTYGYNILMDGRIIVHQPSVPARPGVEGFRTVEAAQLVGEFVLQKIRHNSFPPSVSVSELDSLGVL